MKLKVFVCLTLSIELFICYTYNRQKLLPILDTGHEIGDIPKIFIRSKQYEYANNNIVCICSCLAC